MKTIPLPSFIRIPLLSCLFIFHFQIYGQSTFVTRIGSANSDFGLSCQPTRDHGSILVQAGSSNGWNIHLALSKMDSIGVVEWTKQCQVGDWCVPYSVLQSKDEGYIVFGSATDSAVLNNGKHVLFLYQTDLSGNKLWSKQYELSVNDLASNMVHRKAGGYLAFSTADYNTGGYPRVVVTGFSTNGNVTFSNQYGGSFGLSLPRGIELPNGNICFVATAPYPSTPYFHETVVTLLDSAGGLLWSKSFGTFYDDEPNAVAVNSSNEIFVTGRTYIMNREWDSFLLKLDVNGNKIFSRFYDAGTSNGEIMRCMIANNDGSSILLGDVGTFDERDMTMIMLDANGSVISSHKYTFSPTFTNYPYEMFLAHDGGIVFTGDYRPPIAYRDAILAKTESNGTLPCFYSSISFTEHTDSITDTVFIPSVVSSVVTHHSFVDSIPQDIVYQHVVCALTAGTQELGKKNHELIVYPNPVSDDIFIESADGSLPEKINIYSLDGKKLIERFFGKYSDKRIIKLETLSQGIYFIEVFLDDSVQILKVIKH